jgi:transcriptional regulator with XRE-family HTH domain
MAVNAQRSTEDWEATIGAQIRRERLTADIDQESLASRANVSVGALKNLEAGRGVNLKTLIRVVRALDREDWLRSLSPEPTVSPIALARAMDGLREPKRATSRKRG